MGFNLGFKGLTNTLQKQSPALKPEVVTEVTVTVLIIVLWYVTAV